MTLGLAWFFLTMRIASAHSASGGYKFSVYYGWLAHTGPLDVLRHFASIGNLDMLLGLLLPFLFLPLFRPRWLLLGLPPLFQILLAVPGGSNVVIETHYALLFLPALALASIDAIALWNGTPAPRWRRWLAHRFPLPRPFAIGLGIATYFMAAVAIGPLSGITRVVVFGASSEDRARRDAYDELLARIPSNAVVAASYAALPHVAARSSAYSLAYAYLGVTQYAFAPYVLSEELRYLAMDARDAVAYAAQFPNVGWAAPYATSGPENLQRLLVAGRFGVIGERNGVALLERGANSQSLDARFFTPLEPVHGALRIDDLRDVTISRGS